MLELLREFGPVAGLLIITLTVGGRAAWSIYKRMADRMDASDQRHLDMIESMRKDHNESHEKHLETYVEISRETNKVINNNTLIMTNLISKIDAENIAINRISSEGVSIRPRSGGNHG